MSPSNSPKPTLKSKIESVLPFPLWPRSLAGQLLAALLISLVIAQAVTIILFASERTYIAVSTTRGQVLDRTASVVKVLNQTDESLHKRVIRAAEGPGVLYRIRQKTTLLLPTAGTPEAALANRLERRADLERGTVRISKLDGRLFHLLRRNQDQQSEDVGPRQDDQRGWGQRRWRDQAGEGDWQQPRKRDDRLKDRRPNLSALDMTIAIPLNNGTWLQVRTGVPVPPEKWGRPFLISMLVMAVLIVLVVIFTVRKLTAPLRELEAASRKLGRGESVEPLAETGPKEIRSTIAAFNGMQERLMRFVQDRTRMLAAVSHDLRTPITTMRLRAEFIDDDEMREKILDTLEEMQAMTDAVLAFAREDAASEETKEVDLAALISSLADDYAEMGKDVSFEGPDSLIYLCRPVSLKRAVRNLTENALRYAGSAELDLAKTANGLEITIKDNGPGIPQEKLEEVFAPFFRVEGSRNLETGGVGLGLSITRTIIRSHGGDVVLSNRAEGGLSASITLPN